MSGGKVRARSGGPGLFSFRTLLVGAMLASLLLALAGLWATRLVDTLLVRQTEAHLYSEAVHIRLAFLRELRAAATGELPEGAVRRTTQPPPEGDGQYRPYYPTLEFFGAEILEPPVALAASSDAVHPAMRAAGAAIVPALKAAQSNLLSAVRIVDAHGVVVATTGEGLWAALAGNEEVDAALSGRTKSVLRERSEISANLGPLGRDTRYRVFLAVPIELDDNRIVGAVLLSRTPPSPGLELLGSMSWWLILGAAALTAGGGWLLSSFIAGPLKALTMRAEEIADAGRGEVGGVARPAPEEVVKLSASIGKMVERLETFREDAFHDAADTAHIVKNSLSVIKTAAQSAATTKYCPTPESRAEKLDVIVKTVDWLTGLSNLLKTLAEEERDEREGQGAPLCDASMELREVAAEYADRGVTLRFEAVGGAAPVPMPRAALRAVVENLVSNALLHGGGADVTLTAGPGRTFSVSDSGPGVVPEIAEKLFRLGFTASRTATGGGLGLYAIKRRVQRYGGTVILVNGSRTTFRIEFKAVAGKVPA